MERRLYLATLAVFVTATTLTLSSARMMSGAMAMPGGWAMAMSWMRMPGQSWLAAGAMFSAMWLAMMVAMMLPSSLPMLLLYRRVIMSRGDRHPGVLLWLMSAAYFGVWTTFGVIAYVSGVIIAGAAMRSDVVSRMVPLAAGGALIAAGVYQLTPWKAACLKHCRNPLDLLLHHVGRGWRGALGLGAHHGLLCTGCCWALMLMQLVMGVMNLAAMAAIATVIAVEKMTPLGHHLARAVGVAAIVAGGFFLLRSTS